MEQNEINFRQEREFGDLFNATFAFIRNEYKQLGKAILYFVVPLMLLASILGVYATLQSQKGIMGLQSEEFTDDPTAIFSYIFDSVFTAHYWLFLLCAAVANTLLTCTVLGYIKLYVTKGKDNFTTNELWTLVSKIFLPVLGATILSGFVIGLGLILCFIPGVYLGVSLSLLLPIIVMEGKGIGDSFSRSFKLTKPDFWMILGALIVIMIIFYIISMIFSIPASVLGFKNLFAQALESGDVNLDFGISYYITNGIATLFTYIAGAIPTIFISFIYFSQLEKHEKPLLEDKIEQISDETSM